MSNEDKYPISEIFGPTIQGEGPQIGKPCFFIRFAGCDFRCDWCDTKYAWDTKDAKWQTALEVSAELLAKGARCGDWIVLTGGNPALFVDGRLCHELRANGFLLAMETQGSRILRSDVSEQIGVLVVSPKPPSAGITAHAYTNHMTVQHTCERRRIDQTTALKYIVFDNTDLAWVKGFDAQIRLTRVLRYLSVGTPLDSTNGILGRTLSLVEMVTKDPEMRHFTILPQLHVLLWGRKRGV